AGDGRLAAAVPSAAPPSTPTTGAWPAPVVDPGPFGRVQLGGLYTASGTVSSGAPGPMTGTVNYGDGSGDQPLPVQNRAFGLSHLFQAVGTYTVIVQLTDSRAGVGTGYTIVTVSLPQGPPLR
ncbi:MAG: hypothetical protein M3O87_00245, partial [Candidatus Dormibacteraeota bacterium]|nr:hypothetical protein [Candidatus Dormibacteraeota bacterium]